MVTALSILLLSAVGGGIIGSVLTTTYPKESVCGSCEDKQIERDVDYYEDDYSDEYSDDGYNY